MGRGKVGRAVLAIVVVVVLVVALDDVFARAAVFGIDQYRAYISPKLRGRIVCRFRPTCSAYGREAMRKYGFVRGSVKTVARIARCGPWTPAGTVDLP